MFAASPVSGGSVPDEGGQCSASEPWQAEGGAPAPGPAALAQGDSASVESKTADETVTGSDRLKDRLTGAGAVVLLFVAFQSGAGFRGATIPPTQVVVAPSTTPTMQSVSVRDYGVTQP